MFSSLHIDDAASIARLAAEAEFDGHEVFWAVAGDTSMSVESETLAAEFYPDAEVRSPLSGTETLISVEKARELLGWVPEWTWRECRASFVSSGVFRRRVSPDRVSEFVAPLRLDGVRRPIRIELSVAYTVFRSVRWPSRL